MRPDGRSSAAPVSSTAPKKKSFDRGGPVWPPRSNVANDRLGGGWGGEAPPAKIRGVWGAAPPSQNFSKNRKIEAAFDLKIPRKRSCYNDTLLNDFFSFVVASFFLSFRLVFAQKLGLLPSLSAETDFPRPTFQK